MKVMRSVSIGIAAVAVGAAFILPRAQAVPGEPSPRHNETVVDPSDPIMRCEGEKRRSPRAYSCEPFASEVTSGREINLPPEKVTDDVAGCQPGNQPSVSKQISYAKTATVSASASVKFDLKILSGAGAVFSKIKEFGPGIGGGLSYSWSTTFGSSQSYSIPADYGKVSWGIFSQRAIESSVNETVEIHNTSIGANDSYLYTAYGIKVVTPIEEETTKFPQGTLAKDSRDFKSVEEFKELCPNGVLPKYLGGKPDPGKPDPGKPDPGKPDPGKPDPGNPDAAPCDGFLKVVADGLKSGSIKSNFGTDLQNKCKNIESLIRNGGDPASLVTELRTSIQQAKSDGVVTREYADKLDAEAKAILDAA